ncbi:MAG: hypothetical protein WDA13_00735 [Candidatus Shapirobacteria bacterium]
MLGIFGTIENPTNYTSNNGSGLFTLLSNILKLAGVIAGLFFIVQIIMAGYGYISANGDPKKTEAAWAKIYQSAIGLAIVASAFVLASVIGKVFGINILNPVIYGPGT